MLKSIKYLSISILSVILGLIITLDAENMIVAVRNSINACLNTIIPSLFGFMVISSFLMKSRLYLFIFKPVYFLLKSFIRLNEEEFSVFVLSLVGGYPVGAKLISDACDDDPNTSLKRILPLCYCGSPVFIIAIAGIGIYGNAEIGLMIYFSNALAVLLSCIFYSFFINKNRTKNKAITKKITVNIECLISSVISASSSLFPVCAMVVAFGIIIEALNFCGLNNLFIKTGLDTAYFHSIFEISNLASAKNYGFALIPVISSLTSFGGLCILFQVTAIIGRKVKLAKFVLVRIPVAVLSGIICFFIINFVDLPLETISLKHVVIFTETGSPVASIALLFMSAFLMLSSRKNKTLVIDLKK